MGLCLLLPWLEQYCRVFVGPVKAETRIVMGDSNPEWNQVFAIGKDKIQGGAIELSVCNAVSPKLLDIIGQRINNT